jgi:membrane-bound lytic murein transglycosylase F
MLQYYSERAGLPWALVKRQMMQESGGNPDAESGAGAIGLLQLMSGTAQEVGCLDRRNPDHNLRGGTEYLARQLANVKLLLHGVAPVSDDDYLRMALASYNGGYGYVRAAIKLALVPGQPLTWVQVASLLPQAEVRGKKPDVKQITDYVARILPPSNP